MTELMNRILNTLSFMEILNYVLKTLCLQSIIILKDEIR